MLDAKRLPYRIPVLPIREPWLLPHARHLPAGDSPLRDDWQRFGQQSPLPDFAFQETSQDPYGNVASAVPDPPWKAVPEFPSIEELPRIHVEPVMVSTTALE